MIYFIGIAPPQDYLKRLTTFQLQWPSNMLPHRVEPHITIKSRADMDENLHWISKVEDACASTPPFQLTLGEAGWFAKNVLYLSVTAPEIFTLHQKLLPIFGSTAKTLEQHFEGDFFRPHLTLANSKHGMTQEELEDMAEKASASLKPYASFQVDTIIIYRYDNSQRDITYSRFRTIPLKKKL